GPRLGQQLQALLLQALEAVGTSARLEGTAAKAAAARLADGMGDVQDLLPALDGTRAGDDAESAGADLQVEDVEPRRLLLDLGARHLVRRQDRDHFLDPLASFQ